MKTKMMVLVTAILLLLPAVARAESHELPGPATNQVTQTWNFAVSEFLMSWYYGTFFGGTFYPGPMSFTDFIGSRKNSLGTFTVDFAIGQKLDRLNKFNRDGGNEYDLTLDQSLRFGSEAYPVKVDVGVCYLMLTPLEKFGNDAFDEFVRIDLPIQADRKDGPLFTPYAELFHYHRVSDFSSDGWFWFAGVFRDQKLGFDIFKKPATLNIDYRMGASAGVYGSTVGVEYHRLSLGIPIRPGKGWTIVPTVIGQIPGGSHQTYVTKNEVFATLLLRKDF
jgi:hypothetical protein